MKMKYHSEKIRVNTQPAAVSKGKLNALRSTLYAKTAFSLVETVTALIILALFSSTVLVVINRCMASAADSVIRMQAFEVARENMETLLSKGLVSEMTEYGSSDKYPQIQWQRTVETFYEPITSRMWVQAVCSAEYTDSQGQVQTIELTHWLTDVTKEQLLQIMQRQEKQAEQDNIIKTAEEAAQYAGIDEQTLQQWLANGMATTEDGCYIKSWLDLYMQTDGAPSIEQKNLQRQIDQGLIEPTQQQDQPDEQGQGEEGQQGQVSQSDEELIYGYTVEQLEQMSFEELWEIMLQNQ